jgi:hypothetical protein
VELGKALVDVGPRGLDARAGLDEEAVGELIGGARGGGVVEGDLRLADVRSDLAAIRDVAWVT